MDDGDQGSGCILAHCMGLGKSLQVVTLIHTLLAQSEKTKVHRVLILAPLNTVTNWEAEFNKWLPKCHANQYINVVELSMLKDDNSRAAEIEGWYEGGGVLILGYERFRNLTNEDRDTSEKNWLIFQKCLLNPGPELVVCDEGHILKSDISLINMSVNNIKTERRIILTGTPLQNNLIEYYCMIQFVKPNLLGNKQEYANMFVNPIANGQYFDSTADDIALMKQRSHILHSILDGFVQRRDASVLVEFLPSKEDHVIFVAMSELQEKLYKVSLPKRWISLSRSDGFANINYFVFYLISALYQHIFGRELCFPRLQQLATDMDASLGTKVSKRSARRNEPNSNPKRGNTITNRLNW